MLSIQESACPGDVVEETDLPGVTVPPPQTPIPAQKTPMATPKKETEEKDAGCGKTDVDRWSTKIHVNYGHVPAPQLAHCWKEAGYNEYLLGQCLISK